MPSEKLLFAALAVILGLFVLRIACAVNLKLGAGRRGEWPLRAGEALLKL
jgi:hypothetical protein